MMMTRGDGLEEAWYKMTSGAGGEPRGKAMGDGFLSKLLPMVRVQ